ncbi:uncharacterized protein CC84DRAFT_1212727 [Paraphaeosphaeria sporulosa]|uniref:Uncharacterized protein n=1 Tax=Paraphaeosphaeria sporulosa TaxID=1460663 RepID=A0A177CR75_9PLEO|nr:uncharacterized protein CC84DRAFT_1212727 [Paraphaeosphaeria sporulosa]OAG09277.1 hypothetical protein CC84DRAFT_1212727 [Paraphaeosphaeria sporulosa]
MSRTQKQVTHCSVDESDFQCSDNFLLTYFGDWNVSPKNPNGMHEYPRPAYGAKNKTAEETEAGADISKRKTLQPRSMSFRSPRSFWSSGSTHSSGSPPMLPVLMDLGPEQGGDGTVHHPAYDPDRVSSAGVSLDSVARHELEIADALHRAEPTVVDNTSVDLTRAPSSILGLITAATANASAQGWWPEDLSVVRALDPISFSSLPLTAGAHRPQSQLEQLSTSQSFFGDMRRLQPDGMSRGQFRHMTSSGTDVAAEMVPQLLSCGWGLWRRVMRRRRRMGMERA